MNQRIDLKNKSTKKEMINYLLWLAGEGMRHTAFADRPNEEDLAGLVFFNLWSLLMTDTNDSKQLDRIARMLGKAGATDRLISLFEGNARKAAENRENAKKPANP